MTLVIGLTGSIASGKSTIAHMFQQLQIPVIDADQIAREVVERGKPAHKQIVETFGSNILQSDGEIDRKKLGSLVFENESERKKLNDIVHPVIRAEMLRQKEFFIAKGETCIVMDIPLLFENNLFHFVEKVLVVYVNKLTQLQRLMERDQSTASEAKQRIRSQMSLEEKAKRADAVIDNNGTKKNSYEQLIALLIKWEVI